MCVVRDPRLQCEGNTRCGAHGFSASTANATGLGFPNSRQEMERPLLSGAALANALARILRGPDCAGSRRKTCEPAELQCWPARHTGFRAGRLPSFPTLRSDDSAD